MKWNFNHHTDNGDFLIYKMKKFEPAQFLRNINKDGIISWTFHPRIANRYCLKDCITLVDSFRQNGLDFHSIQLKKIK